MNILDRLLASLGYKRDLRSRYYKLDEKLHSALVDRADREQRPAEEIQAELLAAGLEEQSTYETLLECWQSLSPREKDVTALTCLGYTNRQIASWMQVSPGTVKGYIQRVLIKFHFHSKDELKMILRRWDFSSWGKNP